MKVAGDVTQRGGQGLRLDAEVGMWDFLQDYCRIYFRVVLGTSWRGGGLLCLFLRKIDSH